MQAVDPLLLVEDYLLDAGLDRVTVRRAIVTARQRLGGQRIYIRRTDPAVDREI